MQEFKKLKIWEKAIEITEQTYKLTRSLPLEEKYGLVSQMNRCAVSIASNIAEGAGRDSNKEFIHFLNIAIGSSFELETQLIICERIEIASSGSTDLIIKNIVELQKMVHAIKKRLSN